MKGELVDQAIGWAAGLLTGKSGISGLAGFGITVAAVWDGMPEPVSKLLSALVIVMVLDMCLGVAAAIKEQRLSWAGTMKGLWKTLGYGGLIAFGVAIDLALQSLMPNVTAPFFVIWVLAWLTVKDGLSVLDHYATLGFPLPKGLRKMLRSFKRRLDAAPPGAEVETAEGGGQ